MRKLTLLTIAVLFVAGCATLLESEDKIAAKAIDAGLRYCAETDPAIRERLRAKIADNPHGLRIEVTCPE